MSYIQLLMSGLACLLVSGGIFVAAGVMDREGGYNTPWNTLSITMAIIAFGAAAYVVYLLLPYLAVTVFGAIAGGMLILIIGIGKVVWLHLH